MKLEDRYIDDVMRNVFASVEDRERLEADLRSHFSDAEAEGRSPRGIIEGLGSPEEVAAVVNFLCTEEHMYVHGQVIGITTRVVAWLRAQNLNLAVPIDELKKKLKSS